VFLYWGFGGCRRHEHALNLVAGSSKKIAIELSDSDHAGNADASIKSGMLSFVNGNYFHGYSSGQKCQTLNTAESEYISMGV